MSDGELRHAALNGSAEYVAALDVLCASARHTLLLFEKDFDNLGFNSAARYDVLRHFLLGSPNARLHLLAHDVRPLVSFCPRMMMLLRQFGHAMHIHQTPLNLRHVSAPFAVADEQHSVRRYHFDDVRGIWAQNDPESALLLKSRFEEMWEGSRPGAAPDALGL